MKQLLSAFSIGMFAVAVAACGKPGEPDAHAGAGHGEGHEIAAEVMPVNIEYVDNFVLLDQDGVSHELYYNEDASAIVLMVQGNGCPIVRNAWADFKTVRDEFEGKGVKFVMLNANPQDSRKDIAGEREKFGYDVPILKDEAQLIAASLGITRTAEVLVIDPKTWKIAYRGPVNDRLGYGRQRAQASENYLSDALSAVTSGAPVSTPAIAAKGCVVNMRGANDVAAHTRISYSETIAPILLENCVTCHQEGGIGPWAMSDYDMIEGFAPTIREVVRTQRMPPWSADPEVGEFHGARQLSVEQRQNLVRWIEAGAPRGDGPDPLTSYVSTATDWPLGPPDLIIEAPAFEVPASGVIDYQFPTALNPLTEDKWVRAVTVAAGDKTVVHHALVGSSQTVTPPGEGSYDDVFENYLVGFVPGSESYVYPENTGVLVKAGGEFRFQMHYTASGRATTDATKLGLYFYDEKPDFALRQQVAVNLDIDIPARVTDHTEQAYFEFDHPAEIYMLFPHAHFRGKASKFEVRYPDGRVQQLLSVPRYDFNWQHTYALKESVKVPAGARLVHTTTYDNSEKNFANPDPDRRVPWGLQSADEMLYGSFFFRWSEETHDTPIHNELAFRLRQYYGFADANIDGELDRSEMDQRLRQAMESGQLRDVDADENGALSFDEFYGMQVARLQGGSRGGGR